VHEQRDLVATEIGDLLREERDDEDPGERHQVAAPDEASHGIRHGEGTDEEHARQVDVAADGALGRVHGGAGRPEQNHKHGVCRDQPPRHVSGAAAGVPSDREPGDDEPKVAERVRGLQDQFASGVLAKLRAPTHVRAEPATEHGRDEESAEHRRLEKDQDQHARRIGAGRRAS